MPRVRETPEAYIVESSGAEQFGQALQSVLPSVLLSIRQLMQQRKEQVYEQTKLRMQYNELSPEQQSMLANDEVFYQMLTGKKAKAQTGAETEGTALLPVRDLTQEELLSRQELKQKVRLQEQNIAQNDILIKKTQQEFSESERRIKAYQDIDSVPPEQLTLMDFAVGYPELSWEERAALFTEKKYPGHADRIAQIKAGAGPEIDRMNTRAAFDDCVTKFGDAKNCFSYADAMGRNDLDALEKLTHSGMRTLAYRNYELNLRQTNDAAKRLDRDFQQVVGSAALRLMDDDPRMPLTAARSIAEKLMAGKPLSGEEMKWDINRAALKAETVRMTTAKLQMDLDEKAAGIDGMQKVIDQHLKILAQENGVPADVKKLSTEQLQALMPELVKRVTKQFGIPPALAEKDEGGWFTGIKNFIYAGVGLAADIGGLPMGMQEAVAGMQSPVTGQVLEKARGVARDAAATPFMERSSAQNMVLAGRDIVVKLKQMGKVVSEGLEVALGAVDKIRTFESTVIEGALADTTPPPVAKPGSFKLDPDQQVHLQNLTLEITTQLKDRSIPLPIVNSMSGLLDLIEDVEKGRRPFSAILDANINRATR